MSLAEQVKNELYLNLSFSQPLKEELERVFYNTNDLKPNKLVLGCAAFIVLWAVCNPQVWVYLLAGTIYTFGFGVWAAYELYKLIYQDQLINEHQLKTLADFTCKQVFSSNTIAEIERGVYALPKVIEFNEKALKNVAIKYTAEVNIKNKAIIRHSNTYSPSKAYKAINSSEKSSSTGREVSPGVYIAIESLWIEIKTDIRYKNSNLTPQALKYLFEKALEYLPQTPLERILIKQYSSSKAVYYDYKTLQSESLQQLRQRNTSAPRLKHANPVPIPTPINKPPSFPAPSPPKSNTSPQKTNTLPSTPLVQEKNKLRQRHRKELDLAKKRKKIEQRAMKWVIRYEKGQGRQPKDVSSENLGYDILSTDRRTGEEFWIEVKGKATEGNIYLTDNEYRTAQLNPKEYYIYIVENCDSIFKQPTITRLRDIYKVTLPQEIVSYSVDYQQLNLGVDEECLIP